MTYISVERAAPALDMQPHQIWRAIREKKFPFPFVRIGKLIRIDARAIGLTPSPEPITGDHVSSDDQSPAHAAALD